VRAAERIDSYTVIHLRMEPTTKKKRQDQSQHEFTSLIS
jgi:hypothetical protein